MSIIFPTKADVGDKFHMKATVKQHSEYQGNQIMIKLSKMHQRVLANVSQGWTVVYTEVHWTEGNIAILVS